MLKGVSVAGKSENSKICGQEKISYMVMEVDGVNI